MLHLISAFTVVSWSYMMGRIAAFGCRSKKVIYWKPNFTSKSWYHLTPILFRLPNIKYFHGIILLSSAFYLFIVDSFPLLLSIIFLTVSLHTFIPIFVIHTHSDITLLCWSLLNFVCMAATMVGTVCLQFITGYLAAFTLIPPTAISVWFFLIQIQLCMCTPITFKGIEEKRKPRII